MDAPGTKLANGAILLAERPTAENGRTVVLALTVGEVLPFAVWTRRRTEEGDNTYSGTYFAPDELDKAFRLYKGRA